MVTVARKINVRSSRTLGLDKDGRVSVSLSMESIYWNFFRKADTATGKKINRFEESIQTVVWGALGLESLLNATCVRCLRIASDDPVPPPDWDDLRTTNWRGKLALLRDLARRPKTKGRRVRKRFERVMKLRNRLAHFSEDPTPLNLQRLAAKGKMPAVEFFQQLFGETSLERMLPGDVIRVFRRDVVGLRHWLETLPLTVAGLRGKKTKRRDPVWLEDVPEEPAPKPTPPASPS